MLAVFNLNIVVKVAYHLCNDSQYERGGKQLFNLYKGTLIKTC
jgi:hypothetical protein